ncbi:MAG: hypothetical protein RL432_2069 [Bacteroidota bacterium]|jgi:hypothetical protein
MSKTIFIKTLIIVALIIGIRVSLNLIPKFSIPGYAEPVHVTELIEISDVTVLFTGAFFVIALILAGTMSDYKESEKLPGEIASNLEALEDHMLLAIRTYKSTPDLTIDKEKLYQSVYQLTLEVLAWFNSREKNSKTIYHSIRKVNEMAYYIARIGGDKEAVKGIQDNLNQLRKNLTRTYYIARTEFLAPAYFLLMSIVGCVISVLFMCKFKTPMAGFMVTGLVSFIFIYLVLLIKGLDNPFDYGVDDTNVDLLPVERFKTRIEEGFYEEEH